MLTELGHNLCEEVESVWLVLSVGIGADHHVNDVFNHFWLSQNLEESFVFSEFAKNGAGVKSHVQVILVVLGKVVD